MDGNNWNAAALGGEAVVDGSDWRATLQADTRGRIVSKIMETLKRHLPFHNQEGLQELQKIAVRFEEKIYTVATSQSDYLRKISVKMLTLPANSAGDVSNPSVAGASPSMQSQDPSQGQSLPIPLPANQPQPRPQLLTQNNMHSAGLQSSATLQSSLPPVSGMNQIPINDADQNASMQNMYNIAQNPGQGVLLNMFGNTHRQMPGRNQFFGQQQQQQLQNPQQYLHKQQQFQQQLLLNQRNLAHAMMQSQLQQQQQQNGLQSSQFQQPQQFGMQTSSVMQPSVMQSSNFTAQTGQENGDDWQEEIYQKIKAKREMYLPELEEMLIKVVSKLEQHDSLPQLPKSDQLEKLKKLKIMLEGMINSLQVHKENVIPILSFKNLPNKPMPAMQQPPSQNPQLQPMNMQSSVSAVQQNNMSNMQHGLSGVQRMYSLQPQGNANIPPLLGKVVSVPDAAAHGSSKAFISVTGKSGVAEHDQPLEELIKAAGDVWNPVPLHHFAAMIFFFLCFIFFVFGQWGQCS